MWRFHKVFGLFVECKARVSSDNYVKALNFDRIVASAESFPTESSSASYWSYWCTQFLWHSVEFSTCFGLNIWQNGNIFSLSFKERLSLSNFAKLLLWDAKFDQNTNFDKMPSAKCFFVNLVIQESKFWKITQLFIASVSLVRDFLTETKTMIILAKTIHTWSPMVLFITWILHKSQYRFFFRICISSPRCVFANSTRAGLLKKQQKKVPDQLLWFVEGTSENYEWYKIDPGW